MRKLLYFDTTSLRMRDSTLLSSQPALSYLRDSALEAYKSPSCSGRQSNSSASEAYSQKTASDPEESDRRYRDARQY
ncbi:hypothetical protein H6F88_07315 [Oculatella sp. FACHB-28]|uniref:hypothetical protein n=1 Tax=Oculatella sp. FACHB-28 TaxID=2692845 RepID=UPI0016867AB1|nr:hypothetical protein [Oculatella sp. FACHB-28]MBD2055827.1 hypothetical protein [Oculatella sp. FACHB-28]